MKLYTKVTINHEKTKEKQIKKFRNSEFSFLMSYIRNKEEIFT